MTLHYQNSKFVASLVGVVLSLILVSCSENVATLSNNVADTPSSVLSDKARFTGVVHANYVSSAKIRLYGIRSDNTRTNLPLASTNSDSKGNYEFQVNGELASFKAYVIEAEDGYYIDEATGVETKLETPMKSISYAENGQVTVAAITPATDIVTRVMETESSYEVADRDRVATAVTTTLLGSIVEDGLNLFETLPIDLDDPLKVNNSEDHQKIYSTLMVGLSELQKDTNKSIEEISEELAQEFVSRPGNGTYTGDGQIVETSLLAQFQESMQDSIDKIGDKSGVPVDKRPPADDEQADSALKLYTSGGSYKPGDRVVQDGIVYLCKEWPAGGWCSIQAYKPGGAIWSLAWDSKGGTTETIAENNTKVTPWSGRASYVAGDQVYYDYKVYECRDWPYTAWCSVRAPGSNGWEEAWKEFKGSYTIAPSSDIEEPKEEEIKQVEEKEREQELERPELTLVDGIGKYTLLISAEHDESNRPQGYELYKNGQLLQKTEWDESEETTSFLVFNKEEKRTSYYVKTYLQPVQESRTSGNLPTIYSEVSQIRYAKAKEKEVITPSVEGNVSLPQSLITTSLSSFRNVYVGDISDIIFVSGGDGDGEIEINSSNTAVATVQPSLGGGDGYRFLISTVAEGDATISVYKDASSDGRYSKSNVITISVKVIKKQTSAEQTSDKQPGKPVIGWFNTNVAYGTKPSFVWNLYWGQTAKTVRWYWSEGTKEATDLKKLTNLVAGSEQNTTDFNPGVIGAQSGGYEHNLENNTSAVSGKTYSVMVELCNGTKCTASDPRTLTYAKENVTPPVPAPVAPSPSEGTGNPYVSPEVPKNEVTILTPAVHVASYMRAADRKEITAYFGQWTIYRNRGALSNDVKFIPADKLTAINYAFLAIRDDGSIYSLDKYADFDKHSSESDANYISPSYTYNDGDQNETVGYIDKDSLVVVPNKDFKIDGKQLKGNFKQMMLLKLKYPHLEIYPSYGGWTKSNEFYSVAADPAKRKKFAQDAVDFARKYGLDGIDVDWEFPVRGGESARLASEVDQGNFTLLMQDIRDAIEADVTIGTKSTIYPETVYSVDFPKGIEHPNHIRKKLGLTIAVFAGPEGAKNGAKLAGVDYEVVKDLVDKINIMSYDFHGAWDAVGGKSGHQAALFNNNDSTSPHFNVSSAYEKVRRNHDYEGSPVVPNDKIAVGLAFYGRMAPGVKSDAQNGYQQSFSNIPIRGTFENANADYYDLEGRFVGKNGYERFWDSTAKVPYLYNKTDKVFITYDDPLSIALKSAYFMNEKGASVFYWEMSGDTKQTQEVNIAGAEYTVPGAGALLSAVHTALADEDFYEKYKDATTFAEATLDDTARATLAQERLVIRVKALHAEISDFNSSQTYQKLKTDASALDSFDFNETAIESNISLAVLPTNDTNINASLENQFVKILGNINLLFDEQQAGYDLALLKDKTEKDAAADLARDKAVYENYRDAFGVDLNAYKAKTYSDVSQILSSTSYTITSDDNASVNGIISAERKKVEDFNTSFKTGIGGFINDLNTTPASFAVGDSQLQVDSNQSALRRLRDSFDHFESSRTSQLAQLERDGLRVIANARSKVESDTVAAAPPAPNQGGNDDNDNGSSSGSSGSGSQSTSYSNSDWGVNIVKSFTIDVTKNGVGASITLTYKPTSGRDVNFRDAKVVISGPDPYTPGFSSNGISWVNPTESYEYDVDNNKVFTVLDFDSFAEEWVDTMLSDGEYIRMNVAPQVWSREGIDLKDVTVVHVSPGKNPRGTETAEEAKPNRKDPVRLEVRGWPSKLAMGTVTDNDFGLNQQFRNSRVDSIFKYEGDGFGDRGDVIQPDVTIQTIKQAREMDALDTSGKTRTMPTLVVYTANGSGGGVAPHDILTNHAIINGVVTESNTDLVQSNLVKHFRNTIRMASSMQASKTTDYPYPATIVLNADLFGEWQKNKQNGSFQEEYCGGLNDRECSSFKEIPIKDAMKAAIDLEADYVVRKYGKNSTKVNGDVNVDKLSVLYTLADLRTEIDDDANISNDIKGWVQSQNYMLKRFAPDVPFGWVINLWNPGSAHWVHEKYAGERQLWDEAAKSVAVFTKWIGAYDDNDYRPDFLAFDKYERDGLGAAGKPSYAFSSRAWDNYLMYVKQITDFIDTPAMLWQIPGGHLVTNTEDLSGDGKLCTGTDSANCFRHLDTKDAGGHSATGGSYFMGDKKIGKDINSSVRSDVLNIQITGEHYNGASNVRELMAQAPDHDWGVSQLRRAVYSNAFSILWGGGETTGTVPISTNKTGGYKWLADKVVAYQNNPIPLYATSDSTASASTSSKLTAIDGLNKNLNDATSAMNNKVLLFNTGDGLVPSSIYKWEDFLKALKAMHNTGIAGDKFWLFDDANDPTSSSANYAKVAIAAFLAQSMQETIQYDACDENSWQFLKDAGTSEAVASSIHRGDFDVDLPMDAACGQLGQVYVNYGVDEYGVDNPYSCPRDPRMEVTATTHAKYYGAAGPLFAAPDSVLEDLGLLIDGKPGRWTYSGHCNGTPATATDFETPDTEGWLREDCNVYKGQKAGSYVWDGSSKRSLEGCGWWGRGVIQTTGRENFGKLNHFVGRSHVDKDILGTQVSWADSLITVEKPPENPLYADLDLCSNPQLICTSTEHKEIKWIAGLFYWMNSVQAYEGPGIYAGWNYKTELKKYVDSGFGKTNYQPYNGISFIDSVSGIVNRGCPDKTCPVSGEVHGSRTREDNFVTVLKEGFGLEL